MKKAMSLFVALALCTVFAGPASAEETIKIGVAGAHSGDLASYGVPSLNAAKVVIADVNARGGILGRQLELVSQDDQCKPELATNAATKLISDKVAVVMGHICSGPTKATLPLYTEARMVSMSPSATTPALTEGGGNPFFFRTIANDKAQARLTSDFILNGLKAKNVAYLHDNGEYGKGFVDGNREALEKAGVTTVLYEAVTPDAVDFSAVVRKLRRAKPDLLVFGGYQPTASKLLQQMRRDRVTTPMLGPDGLKDDAFIKMAGKDSEGVYTSYPKDTSGLAAYKHAREGHVKMFGSDPGSFYYNAYAATVALINAMEKAGSTETDKIVEALHTCPVDTPLGTLTFSKTGDAAGMALSIYQIKDGKFVELDHSITLE
ncbi:MAG: branched-chain amino acid ABC transporter substrate-binding protein [Desulfovibrio desulfuricans]|uniref:branched-chain amino acid ABC transporter substrate-binding protein n=1 Tax=uncultured Desulfovibrio sp. TaxID=167968 RepID=UPI00261AA26C|nr:branched-chain amino acid ABC transporter substrate-binding protein [uncultured Desulfovibrio sp.]MBE6441886.1 branched-chain amino acid ABC transporter substrate-binding protein [Desulfovibrio desulfuricans]